MLAPTIHGRRAAGCQDQGKMLGRDESSAPAADGRLPDVEEEGAALQGGGQASGVCFKEGHKVIGQVQKRGDPENPNT